MKAPKKAGHLVIATLAIVATFILGSCYWNPQSGVGRITLNLHSGRAQVDSSVQWARVYLYSDDLNNRISIGDAVPYAEAAMSSGSGSVTVDRVLAGTGYRVVLTLGTKPDGATFVPDQFGISDTFNVTAGHETNVSISSITTAELALQTYQPLEFDQNLLGKNIVAVATDGNYIAASTVRTAYIGNSIDYLSTAVSPGGTINSISYVPSFNSGEFWLNSSNGITEFEIGRGIVSTALPAGGPTSPVYRSGAFPFGNGYAVYYQREGGLGGVLTYTQGPWVSINLSSNLTSQPVFDMAFNNQIIAGFFATTIGGVVLSPEVLIPGNNTLDYVVGYGGFFTIPHNGKNLLVTTIAIDGTGNLYAGTSAGTYIAPATNVQATMGSLGPPVTAGTTVDLLSRLGGGQLIPTTDTHPFRMVAAGGQYSVAVSNHTLFISYLGQTPIMVPLAALTLGDLNAVAVDPNGGFILLAGTEGLTYITITAG